MNFKIILIICSIFASLGFCETFEDFESYVDNQDLVDSSRIQTPVAYGSDPNSPDGGKIELVLNTSDAYEGNKCLQMHIGNYDIGRRYWQFKPEDSAYPWDWSSYNYLRFYYKGDVDLAVNIHNLYVPGLVLQQKFSRFYDGQWTCVTIDISEISRNQVQLLHFTVYNRTGEGEDVLFDNFELLQTPMFSESVDVYYPGEPSQMTLNWSLTDPNITPVLSYGIDGYEKVQEIEGSLDFEYTISDLIPSQSYIYKVSAGDFVEYGKFAAGIWASDSLIIENYETYADEEALSASPLTFANELYGCTTTAYLEEGFDGQNAVRFEFYKGYGGSVAGGVKLDGVNLKSYDKLRVWYKGSSTNLLKGDSAREVQFRILDSTGIFQEINVGRVVANDYWDYVEFDIDSSDSSRWDNVTYILARIERPKYEILNFSFDRIEALRVLERPLGDVTGDFKVNNNDLGYIVNDWLVDSTQISEQTTVAENFESYSQELDSWSLYYNSTAPSMLSLLDSNAFEGNNALQWNYDVQTSIGSVYSEILYQPENAVDLSQYDKVRIKIKRYSSNSSESYVYIKFLDGGVTNENLSGKSYLSGATVAPTEDWFEWEIDLHQLNYVDGLPTYSTLDDITNVQGIMFGVLGNAGSGRIDIDYIRLIKNPQCSVDLASDINSDCTVDMLDYSTIAIDWLVNEGLF